MRKVDDDGTYIVSECKGDGSCGACQEEEPKEEKKKLEVPEVKGNPFDRMSHWKAKATDNQVGGEHYKDFLIPPAEFVTKNKLGYLQGSVIYRMCRYDRKGTPLEDLEKAKHEIDLLIQLEGLK